MNEKLTLQLDRNEALYKTTSTTTQAPQVVFVTRDRFPTSGRDERLPVGRPRPRPRPAQKNRRPRPRLPIYYDDYYDYDYNSDYEESLADEDEGQADQNEAEVAVEVNFCCSSCSSRRFRNSKRNGWINPVDFT